MLDPNRALVRIESAERDVPFCWCGAPTAPYGGRTGAVWLRCTSSAISKGVLRQLLTLDFSVSHIDEPIVELADLDIAA